MHLQAEAGLFVMLDLREFLEDSSKVGFGDCFRRSSFFFFLAHFFFFLPFLFYLHPLYEGQKVGIQVR